MSKWRLGPGKGLIHGPVAGSARGSDQESYPKATAAASVPTGSRVSSWSCPQSVPYSALAQASSPRSEAPGLVLCG